MKKLRAALLAELSPEERAQMHSNAAFASSGDNPQKGADDKKYAVEIAYLGGLGNLVSHQREVE